MPNVGLQKQNAGSGSLAHESVFLMATLPCLFSVQLGVETVQTTPWRNSAVSRKTVL